MRPTTLIDRDSHCRDWATLADEVHDALIDALQRSRWPHDGTKLRLIAETAAHLLPPDPANPDLLRLSAWLRRQGIKHAFLSLRGGNAHRLRVQALPAVSQDAPPPRITPQAATPRRGEHPATDRSHTMHAKTRPAPAPKKRSLWERLFPRRADWDKASATTALDDHGLEPAPALERSSWMDSANRALTDATAQFIRDYVEPLHSLNGAVFSVRSVCVSFGEDAAPCLEAWEKLPPQVRNSAAKILMEQAQGADRQLAFDQFYGLSFDPDAKLLDGQGVRTLVAFSGRRVPLRFRFDGDYIEAAPPKPAPRPKPATVEMAKSAPPLSLAPQQDEPPVISPAAKPAATTAARAETPLLAAKPTPAVNVQKFINKGETPLVSRPARRNLARLRIQPHGGAALAIDIREGELPYVIGRDPGPTGYNTAPDEAPAGTGIACSRQHLVLEAYDAHSGCFRVNHPAYNRNGTFDRKGHPLPERFLWRPGEKLDLGGSGEGSVRIALEAAP